MLTPNLSCQLLMQVSISALSPFSMADKAMNGVSAFDDLG